MQRAAGLTVAAAGSRTLSTVAAFQALPGFGVAAITRLQRDGTCAASS